MTCAYPACRAEADPACPSIPLCDRHWNEALDAPVGMTREERAADERCAKAERRMQG